MSHKPRLGTVAIAALLATMIVRIPEAPATVAEQRARLPPAAECESPVEGKWRALIYSQNGQDWYEFTLEIHHDPVDEKILTGTILVDTWYGPEDKPEPPTPCTHRIKGKMKGHGTYPGGVDGEVYFGGTEYEVVEEVCGYSVGYNPDNFTGRIEPDRQEFQSVNNDGGVAVNEPTVFRRIGCFDNNNEPKQPEKDVKKPAFFPKRRSTGGC
jgi:hypothetical protein